MLTKHEPDMRVVPQYKEFADECRKLAVSAKNPEHKKQLLEMAAAWDALNEEQRPRFSVVDDLEICGHPFVRARPSDCK
jgi:hypothetical protein